MHEWELLICISAMLHTWPHTHNAQHNSANCTKPSKAPFRKSKPRLQTQWVAAIHLCSPRRTAPVNTISTATEPLYVSRFSTKNHTGSQLRSRRLRANGWVTLQKRKSSHWERINNNFVPLSGWRKVMTMISMVQRPCYVTMSAVH